jgi:hypothetical protein
LRTAHAAKGVTLDVETRQLLNAVSGHGLNDIIARHFAQSAAFFSQPLEIKQEIAIEKTRFHRCSPCVPSPAAACRYCRRRRSCRLHSLHGCTPVLLCSGGPALKDVHKQQRILV